MTSSSAILKANTLLLWKLWEISDLLSAYLLEAAATTGAVLPIDGGQHLLA